MPDNVSDDPVFLSRVQWRIQGLLYENEQPVVPADAATRDRVREMGLATERPRAYLLSNDFAPGERALRGGCDASPRGLHTGGFEWGGHDHLLRVRYDVSGTEPKAELIPKAPDPTAIARSRLDALLHRGAKFIWAELVQANYTLYQPGQYSAACMVMFSFDYTVSADEMRVWAEQLHPLKHTNPADPMREKPSGRWNAPTGLGTTTGGSPCRSPTPVGVSCTSRTCGRTGRLLMAALDLARNCRTGVLGVYQSSRRSKKRDGRE